MKRCVICGEQFETGAGLASHRRAKHPGVHGKNRIAAEAMIVDMENMGRLDPIDAARVQVVRSIADQLDCDPSNAAMWRTYLESVTDLMGPDEDGDDIETLIAQINSRAPVGDTKET